MVTSGQTPANVLFGANGVSGDISSLRFKLKLAWLVTNETKALLHRFALCGLMFDDESLWIVVNRPSDARFA